MEKFKKFKIQNQEMILAGKVVKTIYQNNNGSGGIDLYDCDTGETLNLLGQEM